MSPIGAGVEAMSGRGVVPRRYVGGMISSISFGLSDVWPAR
jgi:hypothetical protein